MKKDHPVLDFIKFPVPHKIEIGRNVEGRLRTSLVFKAPDVTPDELKAVTDSLETRNVAALNGGRESTALLHQAELDWDNKMRLVVRYVDRVADGDSAIILSAGLTLAKQPTPSVRPEFSVAQGDRSGSVLLRRQRMEGGRSYIWQYYMGENPGADANWVNAQVTSQASVELNGLTPLTKYWFRVAVVTIDGTTDFCTPVMQIVI